jgi:gliding motility-associated-like protein
MKKLALVLISLFCCITMVEAQPCGGTISSFPYIQDFEASDGGWTAGGTASDWAWGHPTKPLIDAAAGGLNCWVTGGLTNSSYNSGENSWLMSPCFDFSSLQHPEINFNIFWETERRFDGASFQYSTDGGTNWTLLGNTTANPCDVAHWYNTDNITYLGGTMGWSGSANPDNGSCLGGNGLGRWAAAKHTLLMLAGQPNVRFRFRFGAGTQCNAYDGFAVDDVVIKEAEAPAMFISWGCNQDGSYSFSINSNCISSYQWNFGDPSTGVNNVSTAPTPSHIFSAPGEYLVTLNAVLSNGVPVTRTATVVVFVITKDIDWPGACTNTPDATFTVNAVGSNTPYFYFWETTPPQTTQSISNQGPTNVSVIVSTENGCSQRVQFAISPAPPVQINPAITNASCNTANGSITTNVTGGFPPYTYQWSNGGSTSSITGLLPGSYQLRITDDFGCISNGGPFSIINDNNMLVSLGADRNLCPGQTITLSPGVYTSYRWQDGSTGSSFTVNQAGTYFVEVTNTQGCVASDTIQISGICNNVYFPSAFTPNNDTKNDGFGPLGNIQSLENYSLRIFNRYGELVFSSNNPFQKWNGTSKASIPETGSFVWVASYVLNGKQMALKGNIVLIR